MARFQQSPLAPHISGKIGGFSFSTSLSGKTIKVSGKPRNKDSYESDLTKSNMQFLQNSWRNMTNAQREAWNTFANFRPVEQKNNPGRFINGQQYFIKYNFAYYYQFGSIVTTPVFSVDAPFNAELSINRGLIETSVVSDVNIDETTDFCIFKISGVMPPSRKRPTGGVKQIKLIFGNTTSYTITGTLFTLFGTTPQVGDTVYIEYTFYKTNFIQWSAASTLKVEVV